MDKAGNVYVADYLSHRIRKVTPVGEVSTLAGSGGVGFAAAGFADGPGAMAQFNCPWSVAVDGAGNIYVGDTDNQRIRKITPTSEVSTLAGSGTFGFVDGLGTAARFRNPTGVAMDEAGNLYIADKSNSRIRKITLAVSVVVDSQPTNVTVNVGQTVAFSIADAGTAPSSYQWRKDGSDLSGANTNSLTVPATNRAVTGVYSVVVTNTSGCTTSSPSLLRVLVPQRMDALKHVAGGGFRLRFGEQDGNALRDSDKDNFIIQWSTNVSGSNTIWHDLTNAARAVYGGKVELDDTDANGQPRRFYRVIER